MTELLVRLAPAQLHEDPVGVLRMDPGDIMATVVDPRALLLQMRHAAGDVLALETHQVHALPVPGEEVEKARFLIDRLEAVQQEERMSSAAADGLEFYPA